MNHGAFSHVADKTLATLAVFAKSARLQPTNPWRFGQVLVYFPLIERGFMRVAAKKSAKSLETFCAVPETGSDFLFESLVTH
jgi:hypothetical protein